MKDILQLLACMKVSDHFSLLLSATEPLLFCTATEDLISELSEKESERYDGLYDKAYKQLKVFYEHNHDVYVGEQPPFGLGVFASRRLEKGYRIEGCHWFEPIGDQKKLEELIGKKNLHSVIDVKINAPHLLLGISQFINNCCKVDSINVKICRNGSLQITRTVDAGEPLWWYYGNHFLQNLGITCKCDACVKKTNQLNVKKIKEYRFKKSKELQKRQANAAKNLNKQIQ